MPGFKDLTEEEVDKLLMEMPEGSSEKDIKDALETAVRDKAMLSIDHAKTAPMPHEKPPQKRKVQEGESLSEIALEYSKHYKTDVTAESIAAANKIADPNKVKVDTVLDMTKFIKKVE